MAGATTIAKPAQNVAGDRNPGAPALTPNPFTRAAREVRVPFWDHTSDTLGSSSQQVGPIDIASFGFMRSIVLHVESTSSAGAATFAADGPFSALTDIQVTDTNGNPIIVPISGYELLAINQLTGAATVYDQDIANLPSYSASTTDGSFSFKLRIPMEFGLRQGLGALPNMSAGAPFRLSYNYAPKGNVYTSDPVTTLPKVRVRAWLEAWSQPPAVDARGVPNMQAPPFMGTTSYWSKQVVNVSATGSQQPRVNRTGNLWRNIIMLTRDESGDRIAGMLPASAAIQWQWDSKIMDSFTESLLIDQCRERTGIDAPTGVYLYDFAHDFTSKVGGAAEGRNLYWPTTQASRIELVTSMEDTGTLTFLVNDIVPAEGAVYSQGG